MCSGVWWPISVLLVVATVTDIWKRRIPNWITLPYLVAGVALSWIRFGGHGLGQSAGGILAALLIAGAFCLLRGMGVGDLKLCAAVGAWVGPEQTIWALFFTGLAGGIMAVSYVLWRGSLGCALDGTSDLIAHFARGKLAPHRSITLDNARALSIPYAPAIALGTWFSFFVKQA